MPWVLGYAFCSSSSYRYALGACFGHHFVASGVVSSIRRVTGIMGEISSASSEQSAGMAQVGEAVNQMDQVTQQNAALVEEMAAAASSLKSQAQTLVKTVAVFRVG